MTRVLQFIYWVLRQAWRWGYWRVKKVAEWAYNNWRTVLGWIEKGLPWVTIVEIIMRILGIG